jgi:ribonuclease HII
MKRAIDALQVKADFALIDGNRMPPLDIAAQTIIKGDAKCPSIAAASILAKVSRDRYMYNLDKEMPQYQFAKHKGYGTALHYECIEKYGISEHHRLSFLKKITGEK